MPTATSCGPFARLIFALVLLCSATALPQVSFAPAVSYPTGTPGASRAWALVAADFNGDGKLDLAVANPHSVSNNVSILLNNGAGTFILGGNFTAGTTPIALAAGDFNRDGKVDLVVANENSNDFSLLLGNGAGGFTTAASFLVGSQPFSIVAGDFDRDGKLDVAVANAGSGSVSVYLGDGAGSFGPPALFSVAPVTPMALALSDADRNGTLDILVAGQNGARLLSGNGAGGFTLSVVVPGGNFLSAATADLDRDGKPDALMTQSGFPTGSLTIVRGFTTVASFPASTIPDSVASADFDGDGLPDVVIADRGSPLGTPDQVFVLRGTGGGSLGPAAGFTVGDSPQAVIVGDFNNDGRPDIATANVDTSDVSVLLNTTPFPAGGALAPAVTLTLAAEPLGVGAADLDRNGTTDLIAAVAGEAGTDQLTVFSGNGSGGFGAPAAVPVTAFTTPNSILVGDFNRDGLPDLATARQNADSVEVFLATGGTFGAGSSFAVGDFPAGVAGGDFNRDGILDLAVPNVSSNSVSVLLGDGSGGFGAATNFSTGAFADAVAVGDFNGDGRLDLAVAERDTGSVSVLLGDGAGGFGGAIAFAAGDGPTSVAVGDFNHDGRPDLAVGNFFGNTVSILLGNGSGGFGAATDFAVTSPIAIAIADMDRDGNLDVVAATHGGNSAAVLLGDGAGALGGPHYYAAGALADSITVADFDRDGRPDVAVGNFFSQSVSVLLNTAPAVNHPPVANAGPDQTVNATSASGATVTLDGTASSDPDSDPLSYSWSGPFGTATSATPSVTLPVGTSVVTLTVSDPASATSTDTVQVTVNGAAAQISGLQGTVSGMGLPGGTTTSLNAKLSAALAAYNAGNTATACANLRAFINEVNAQTGKKLTAAQAAALLAQANQLRAVIGCP